MIKKNIFYDNDEKPNNQNYDVHFKHAFKEINNSKTVNETITYIYDNGKEAAPTYNTSVEFTQTGKLDLVTNKEELNDWSPVSNIPLSQLPHQSLRTILPIKNKLLHKQFNQIVVTFRSKLFTLLFQFNLPNQPSLLSRFNLLNQLYLLTRFNLLNQLNQHKPN
nr:hypothetical protein [Lactobacillus paragasseri]